MHLKFQDLEFHVLKDVRNGKYFLFITLLLIILVSSDLPWF